MPTLEWIGKAAVLNHHHSPATLFGFKPHRINSTLISWLNCTMAGG